MVAFVQSLNWLWVVITMLVFSLLIKLGHWQSTRAVEKEQRLARIEQLKGSQAFSLSELIALEGTSNIKGEALLNDLPVALSGTFEPDMIFLHDNQPNNGQLGYRIYQVFNQDSYSVLVNLGWVKGSKNRNVLPDVEPIAGQYTLDGHVRFIDVGVVLAEQHFEQIAWPLRVQQIEADKFSSLINKQLLPFTVFLDKKEQVGYEKNWQPVVMPPEKHRGYAFQWYSLAIAWLVLMIWAAVKASNAQIVNKTIIKKA